jgi:D-serine deaminase-like pyridoxal phosphate-dependent protein
LELTRDLELTRARYDKATAGLEPPLALVDLAAFDQNADDMARRAGRKPIRVATKSIRCRELIERVLRHPGYQGIMCYSLPEALWLHGLGVSDDILVAYPTVNREALGRLAADEAARQHITIIVDETAHLDVAETVRGDSEIRVCLELDVSWRPVELAHIGTRRSPLFTPEQAHAFAREIARREGFRLVGVMGYEGQIAGLGDAPPGNPVKARAVRLIQDRSVKELTERRVAAIALIRSVADLEFVNGGGTGSLESTRADPSVTELAAGSGLVGPTLFDAYTRFKPRPTLLYALPVVRKPNPRLATLFAGGYVASGTGTKNRLPKPYLPAGLSLTGMEGAGEVQTPVRGAAAARLRPGDRVWMRHAKAGELAERFTHYHLLGDDNQLTAAPTYRGDGQSFGLTHRLNPVHHEHASEREQSSGAEQRPVTAELVDDQCRGHRGQCLRHVDADVHDAQVLGASLGIRQHLGDQRLVHGQERAVPRAEKRRGYRGGAKARPHH